MDEKEMIKFLFPLYQEDFVQENFDVFLKLCPKAKQVVFNELYNFDDENCFDIYPLPSFLTELTPIEQIFYVTFLIACHRLFEKGGHSFLFETQEEVITKGNKYICDFMVYGLNFGYGCECDLERKVIIECDGYESHHTKQQRNKDTERENNLKLAGYSFIRFTGSQIYNDPYKCVLQAIAFCLKQNDDFIEKQKEIFNERKNKNAKKND